MSNSRGFDHCARPGRLGADTWAQNLTYLLARLGYVEGGEEAVDEYFLRPHAEEEADEGEI
jgi:hypothetical protein